MDRLDVCRACLAPKPYLFLAMGNHPPANMFLRLGELSEEQPAFPLNAQVCLACGLVQIADQVPPDFFRDYLYVPSGATTMHRHFGELANELTAKAEGGLIVDIGCNDGLLLSACNALGARTLGIDPAANLAKIAESCGVEVYVDYFGPETATKLRETHGQARIIITTNTFNHIGDLHNFMEGVLTLLAHNGQFVIEVPWAKDMIEQNEFDTIYHEHVSEFSLLSIAKLCDFFGLEIVDVARLAVHGGSLRIFIAHSGSVTCSPAVQEALKEELAAGILEVSTYNAFAQRVASIRQDLTDMVYQMTTRGMRVAGYGASARGNTLLNFFRIGPSHLEFLVDRNPLKHGLYSPGMKIPILPTEAISEARPDALLVLAWNFFDEIRLQQANFLTGGGKFIVPLPEPTLISEE